MENWKERQRREKFWRHRETLEKTIQDNIRRLQDGTLTGTPMTDGVELREVRQAMKRSVDTRMPKDAVRGANGQWYQPSIGGSWVPAMPDLKTSDDWHEEERQKAKFSKTAEKIWAAYRLEYPNDSPQAVQAASTALAQSSGMSLTELTSLGQDDMSRASLFDQIHQHAMSVMANSGSNGPTGPADNRTGGFDYRGGGGGSRSQQGPQQEQTESISDLIKATQERTGFKQ